jgi:CBS domain-containing protein
MLRVSDLMTADVTTLGPRTTVREAMQVLSSCHVGGAPVLDGERLVGVVSVADLLQFAASLHAPREDGAGDAADDDERDERVAALLDQTLADDTLGVDEEFAQAEDTARDALDAHTIEEIMTPYALTVGADEPATAAAEKMRREGVHRLLVLDGAALVGIVTTTDLARAVADRRLVAHTFVFPRSTAR